MKKILRLLKLQIIIYVCFFDQEKSIFPLEDDTTNCKRDSYLFLEQQNSGMDIPITEEYSMTSSNKIHDTSGSSDLGTFLEQESSGLEPSTDTELFLQNLVNYCNDDIFSNSAEASGDPWVHGEASCSSLPLENHDSSRGLESSFLSERETSAVAAPSINKALPEKQLSAKKKERNNTTIEEHNAKERVRRMKLYATYGSLGALLPDSESKKKRSAPAIIDRALEYIPELENEIEKLTLKKNNMLSKIENKQHDNQNLQLEHEAPSVLVHEVEKGEVIIQIICSPNDEKTLFSKLLQNLEAKEKGIISVSTLCVWEKRVCYHLHIRMKKDSLATDYVEVLRQDVISWLL
ncbi:hypothetical protein CUMW_236900 [Citrus unshiu]|nr:hypothetical protein CUMW_236900 [Citrus unshiu]